MHAQTRSRVRDEVLDAGGSQGRSQLDPLLEAARRERQGWATGLRQRWRGARCACSLVMPFSQRD